MTIKALTKRLDKAEPEIRRRYPTHFGPPLTATEALWEAIVTRSVEQHHLDDYWNDVGPGWLEWLFFEARRRRVTRLTPGHDDNFRYWLSHHNVAPETAIELLSYQPNETSSEPWYSVPDLWWHIQHQIEITKPFLYFVWPQDKTRPYLREWLNNEHLTRVLQPPDALDLRKQIWADHGLIRPTLHRL
jgi:hypothetical protein